MTATASFNTLYTAYVENTEFLDFVKYILKDIRYGFLFVTHYMKKSECTEFLFGYDSAKTTVQSS